MSNCTASPSGVAVGVGRIPASHPEGYGYSWFCERYQHRRRHLDVVLRQEPKAGEKMYVDWVTTDHTEIGRIQGRQMAALLPHGGMALYLESPAVSQALQQRKCGMLETKPDDIQMRTIRSQCDKQDAATAVPSWLRLSTSQQAKYDLVAAERLDGDRSARSTHFRNSLQPARALAQRAVSGMRRMQKYGAGVNGPASARGYGSHAALSGNRGSPPARSARRNAGRTAHVDRAHAYPAFADLGARGKAAGLTR